MIYIYNPFISFFNLFHGQHIISYNCVLIWWDRMIFIDPEWFWTSMEPEGPIERMTRWLPDAFAWDARIFHDFSGFTDWFFWVCWVDELRVTFFFTVLGWSVAGQFFPWIMVDRLFARLIEQCSCSIPWHSGTARYCRCCDVLLWLRSRYP